jgi:hypothetical protein
LEPGPVPRFHLEVSILFSLNKGLRYAQAIIILARTTLQRLLSETFTECHLRED